MTRGRVIAGSGQAANPIDGDRVAIKVGVRDGRVVTIAAENIRVGMMTFIGSERREVWFKNGTEARASGGETFAGCETARSAALVLYKIFIGHTIEECLA